MPEFNEAQLSQNLQREDADEIFRLAAAEKFVRKNGFDKKTYNKIFGKNKSESLSDCAYGPLLPASYYSDTSYQGSGSLPSNPGSMPKSQYPAGEAPSWGKGFFPEGIIQRLINQTITTVKESAFRIYVTWPIMLRNFISDELNKRGPTVDFATSLLISGWDCAALDREHGDFLKDRIQIFYNDRYELLGARFYDTRKENSFVRWARKDNPAVVSGEDKMIPNQGTRAKFKDLILTREGTISGYSSECGGRILNESELTAYDEFYSRSHTLDWILGDLKKKNLNLGQIKHHLSILSIINYMTTRNNPAKYEVFDPIKLENGTYTTITSVELPGPGSVDPNLMLLQWPRVIGGRIVGKFYKYVGKVYEFFGFDTTDLYQLQVDEMLRPLRPYSSRFATG